jgi:hypothetical protein
VHDADEWITLTSSDVIDRLIGQTVELRAPAAQDYPQHRSHGCLVKITGRDGGYLCLELDGDQTGLSWRVRGNVSARPILSTE